MDENPNLSLPHTSSSQEFLKQVQAALKRHRPLGISIPHLPSKTQQASLPFLSFCLLSSSLSVTSQSHNVRPKRSMLPQRNILSYKKLQFLTETNIASAPPQDESSIGFNQHVKHQNMHQAESEISLVSEGGKSSLLPKRTLVTQDHLQQFKGFLRQPATQSSVVGLPCPTTMSVHSTSATMPNSITRCSNSCIDSGSHVAVEPYGNLNVSPHPITQGAVKSPNNFQKETNRMSVDQVACAVQDYISLIDTELTFKQSDLSKEQQGCMLKETSISKYTSCHDNMLNKGEESAAVTNIQPQDPTSSSDVKLESSKLEKQEKNASSKASSGTRKRT